MLIDGGNRKASSFVVSYLKRQNVESLDYILISHFDEDHLAGAIGALYQFPAGKVITADYETDSSIYKSYQDAMEKQGYEETHPSQGDVFSLGSASVRVISPISYGHEDENEDSVGVIVENGDNRFFFGGDMGKTGEKQVMESGADIAADVFLLNHHGSYLSSRFLEQISPSYAVISCGDGNSYGHPRQDTIKLLEDDGIPVFRTDKQERSFSTVMEKQYPGNRNPATIIHPVPGLRAAIKKSRMWRKITVTQSSATMFEYTYKEDSSAFLLVAERNEGRQ